MSKRDQLAERRATLLGRAAAERREVAELGHRVLAPLAWIDRGARVVRAVRARPWIAGVGALGLVSGTSPATWLRWAAVALDVALLAVRLRATLHRPERAPDSEAGR